MTQRFAQCARWITALTLLTVACGGDQGDKTKPAATAGKADAKTPETKANGGGASVDGKAAPTLDPKADPKPAENAEPSEGEGVDAEGSDGDSAAEAAEGGEAAAEGGEAAAEGGEAAAEGGEAAAEGGEAAAEGGGKDAAALIKEARTTKTTDERALAALAEAEEAGATVKVLARAAKARGDYLYKSPERALVFYVWSAAKDEDYADPVFAQAKQKAVTGDLEDTIKLLKQVSERKGGKKLLQQIDFDPTWDIVKDDPDVRALL